MGRVIIESVRHIETAMAARGMKRFLTPYALMIVAMIGLIIGEVWILR